MRDRQPQRVAEERRDGEPVGDRPDHRRLGAGVHEAPERRLLGVQVEGEDDGRGDEQGQRDEAHPAQPRSRAASASGSDAMARPRTAGAGAGVLPLIRASLTTTRPFPGQPTDPPNARARAGVPSPGCRWGRRTASVAWRPCRSTPRRADRVGRGAADRALRALDPRALAAGGGLRPLQRGRPVGGGAGAVLRRRRGRPAAARARRGALRSPVVREPAPGTTSCSRTSTDRSTSTPSSRRRCCTRRTAEAARGPHGPEHGSNTARTRA